MKDFIENIKDRAREDPKRIVFPESTEERTLKAIEKVLEEGTALPILIGKEADVRGRIETLELNITNVQFVDHLFGEFFNRHEFFTLRVGDFLDAGKTFVGQHRSDFFVDAEVFHEALDQL